MNTLLRFALFASAFSLIALAHAIVAENSQIDLIDAQGKIIAPAAILKTKTPKGTRQK